MKEIPLMMCLRLLALLTALLVSGCANSYAVNMTTAQIQRLELITVGLMSVEIGEDSSEVSNIYCGGVVVGPNEILTARHCVDSVFTTYITSVDYENTGNTFGVAALVGFDEENDLAVLRTSERFSEWVEIRKTKPKKGEDVFSMNHSLGFAYSFSAGKVVHPRRNINRAHYIQAAIAMNRGGSGGGLFDGNGELIGICSGTDGTYMYFGSVLNALRLLK